MKDYVLQSTYSEPGRYAALLDELPTDIAELTAVIRNVLIHYRAGGIEFTGDRLAEVELLRRYSNRADLLNPMLDVLRRIDEGDRTDVPGVQSTGSGGGSAPVRDRLSEADVREIVARFQAGTPKQRLATECGMSLSTMKQLLRRNRSGK